MRFIARVFAVALLGAATAGCAAHIGAPQANIDAIAALRGGPPVALGTISRGPALSPSDDSSTTIRAINTVNPPGGSFTGYLRSALETDLRAAGRLDPNAPFLLQGTLDSRNVDSSVGTGTASLAATFTLTKDGKTVFEKAEQVDAQWPSSFLGAVAIPDAINHFTSLFDQLAVKVLTDPDFTAAFKTP